MTVLNGPHRFIIQNEMYFGTVSDINKLTYGPVDNLK